MDPAGIVDPGPNGGERFPMFPRWDDAKIAIAVSAGWMAVGLPLHLVFGMDAETAAWIAAPLGIPLGLYVLWRFDRDD